MLNTIKSIQNFIDNKLANKLRSDAAELHILNERDMEHRIYHHLANKIDGKRFHIFTNKTFSGLKMKRAGWGIMPDIIIRNRENDNNIELVMELKTQKRAKTAFVGLALQEKIFQDCTKLKKMLDKKELQIKHGVFVYMYRDVKKKHSEDKIKKILTKKFNGNKRLTAICINKYQTAKGDFISEEQTKNFDDSFKNLYEIKVGKKKTKKRKTKDKKRSGQNLPQKKANRTKEKRAKNSEWRRKHPNDVHTKKWIKEHNTK